jgi:type III secretion system YscQ/HrcQ family protein
LAAEALSRLQVPFRVATVLTTTESILTFLGPGGAGAWMIRTQVAERAGTLRGWVPASTNLRMTPSTPRNLSVTFVRDLAVAEVSGETLRGLHLDDVFLFDQAESWGELSRLHALRGTRTTWWVRSGVIETIEEGTSAVRAQGEVMDKPMDTEATQGAQPGTVTANANYEGDTRRIAEGLSAVGDAPLQVALEVARFTLSLDEVARLAPGEVVAAGVQVGDEVRLRAGDRVLAVGDLVDIDGQIGVRIRRLP